MTRQLLFFKNLVCSFGCDGDLDVVILVEEGHGDASIEDFLGPDSFAQSASA